MWLINARTLQLENFVFEQCPPYAIISHRWGEEEVLFQDMKDQTHGKSRKGWLKILKTCEETLSHSLEYVWIDTCCINKESSAELSEAINVMFRYYELSVVCLAYLSDVSDEQLRRDRFAELKQSAWFTRGWTLQELIASQNVRFYSKAWTFIDHKYNMVEELADITGVDRSVLLGTTALSKVPAVTKMSWASQRRTTRQEDLAYCLLGIFDINMPLLYGEGSKAFRRLQEEIIRRSDDGSIFA